MDRCKRILIINPSSLGDFIITLPEIYNIRKTYPSAYIEIMGKTDILELVDKRFYADNVTSFEQNGISYFFSQCNELPRNLVQYFSSFQIVFTFIDDKEGNFVQNLKRSGIKKVYHLKEEGENEAKPAPEIFLTSHDKEFASTYFLKTLKLNPNRPKIAIHPGSGSRLKNWEYSKFIKLATILKAEVDAEILLILGPAEEEYFKAEGENNMGIHRLERLSLLQLASIIEQCQLFIGNDSGVTHMSSALNTSTIAIFGPTDPELWAPKGGDVKIVRKELGCSPCFNDEIKICREKTCLNSIEPEDVMEVIRNLQSFPK